MWPKNRSTWLQPYVLLQDTCTLWTLLSLCSFQASAPEKNSCMWDNSASAPLHPVPELAVETPVTKDEMLSLGQTGISADVSVFQPNSFVISAVILTFF